MKTLLLWDIDGTLLQSKPGMHSTTEEEFLEAASLATGRSMEPPDDTHGSTDFAIMHNVFRNSGYTQKQADDLLFDAFAELQRATSMPSYIDRTRRALPGAKEILQELHTHVVQTYGTGNLPGRAQAKTGFFSLGEYLDPSIGGFGFWTAHRSQFLLHAHQLAEEKHNTKLRAIVIGDTPRDIEGAREAGFDVVAVAGGAYSEAELQGADLVIPDYQDPSPLLSFI